MATNHDLIELVRKRAPSYLDNHPRSEQVLVTMERVDRAFFLPPDQRRWAYRDEPVPIGYDQTCSEPSMVAFMLDKLELQPGQRVLEIGVGCGYAAAIAALLISPGGILYGIERIPELAQQARQNLAVLGNRVVVIEGDGSQGLSREAPFDRILVSAGVEEPRRLALETLLLHQLKPEGVLVYPECRGNLYVLKKGHPLERQTYHGVAFVPLIQKQ
ncbi:MAG: protein-L-isoaspartate O-methyltransferase [Treponemataceae bacterium]|nr:protein-L-isoaspartate O-methyltransferase [Treponemataceae bacterium]